MCPSTAHKKHENEENNRPLVPQSVHASSDQCVTHSAGAGADAASVAGGEPGGESAVRPTDDERADEPKIAAWFAAAFAAAIAPAASCAGGRLSKRLKLEPPIFLLASLNEDPARFSGEGERAGGSPLRRELSSRNMLGPPLPARLGGPLPGIGELSDPADARSLSLTVIVMVFIEPPALIAARAPAGSSDAIRSREACLPSCLLYTSPSPRD